MAKCKICGEIDKSKPGSWDNWECAICNAENMWESAGQLSVAERRLAGIDHAWAQGLGDKSIR